MVKLKEVRDEPTGPDSTSNASVAEKIEMPMAREAPPQPQRLTRLRQARELLDNDEPSKYPEAMVDPNSVKWQDAMKSEIVSMGEKSSLELDWPAQWC